MSEWETHANRKLGEKLLLNILLKACWLLTYNAK